MSKTMMTADDVAQILEISKSSAYILIRKLNKELEKDNYITIAGKIPRKFLATKFFGGVENEVKEDVKSK